MPTLTQKIRLKHHRLAMEDLVYHEGYMAKNHFAKPFANNPYALPVKLAEEQVRVAMTPGPLSVKQKSRLKELRELIDKTEYSRWISGNYARWISKL